MNIYEAASLQTSLIAFVSSAPQIDLDLSCVETIDITGIQLLLATKRTAADHSKPFRILNPSPAVREFASRFGIDLEYVH